tara:strand:+ start:527 stop:709 length:183 start_codon:yes stop_codon:yes gene_type:complete
MKFEIGEIVGIKTHKPNKQKTAVLLAFEPNMLFESVQCVKIMIIGACMPTYTLSDRIYKL